jgi:hypothetical protein
MKTQKNILIICVCCATLFMIGGLVLTHIFSGNAALRASEGEIIEMVTDKHALIEQEGMADLAALVQKQNGQPYEIEKTLVKDIMVYLPGALADGMITRDGGYWRFAKLTGVVSQADKAELVDKSADAAEELEYKDIYCDSSDADYNNSPEYSTAVFETGGFHVKITQNPYIKKYNFGCYADGSENMPFYTHNVRYFKASFPLIYVVYDNGVQQYLDVRNNAVGGRSDTAMEQKYQDVFSAFADFQDVKNQKYVSAQTNNYSNW